MYLQKLHYNGIIISGKIKKDFTLTASNNKYFLTFHILKYEVAYLDKMRRVTYKFFNNSFRKRQCYWVCGYPWQYILYFPNIINLSQDHSILGNCFYKRSGISEGIW